MEETGIWYAVGGVSEYGERTTIVRACKAMIMKVICRIERRCFSSGLIDLIQEAQEERDYKEKEQQ